MDFGLSEEQELLQETVRSFIAGECPPTRLRELFDEGVGHDAALWKGLSEIGLTGLVVPEGHGGAGLEALELALVAEALGGGAVPGPFAEHSLVCLALSLAGSEAQQKRWLPALAAGDLVGSVALAESAEEWEPDAWRLELRDGGLHGEKRFVPFAGQAGLLLVGIRGGGLAIVEAGAPGLEIVDENGIDRTRPIARVRFDGTPAEALPGGEAAAPRVRDAGLVVLAADAFGVAWRLVEMTRDYAKDRKQFGQPIAQFQAVKHQIADMAVEVEPSRGLFWYAAHALDHLPDEAERAAAVAKSHLTDRALDVARAAVELHGGLGFTWECDVQMWFKRAMFDRAFLGTPEHHRDRSATLAGW